jgi:hypothetical protein
MGGFSNEQIMAQISLWPEKLNLSGTIVAEDDDSKRSLNPGFGFATGAAAAADSQGFCFQYREPRRSISAPAGGSCSSSFLSGPMGIRGRLTTEECYQVNAMPWSWNISAGLTEAGFHGRVCPDCLRSPGAYVELVTKFTRGSGTGPMGT